LPERVEAGIGLGQHIADQRAIRAHQKRQPIGPGMCHFCCADAAACAGPVLDHHRLPKTGRHGLGQQPGKAVDVPAGREGDDQA